MRYYVGVDLGGTNIVVGMVQEDGKILLKKSIKTQGSLPFETIVRNMGGLIDEVITDSKVPADLIQSVGVGTPSCVNPNTQNVVHANNMGWKNVPLPSELKKYVSYPLYIKNDADCAALGEAMAGAARDYQNVLMITLGTGVGGGMIINKKIFNGCDHMGGEFGHMKLVYHGVRCTCGQLGCFESYASATALIRQTKEAASEHPESLIWECCGHDLDKIEGRTVFDAAHKDDKTALKVVDQYIDYLAAGLSSLICIFRPDVILIGGGISAQGDFLLDPLNKRLPAMTYAGDVIGVPKVMRAELGNDAGLIGAAMLGREAQD